MTFQEAEEEILQEHTDAIVRDAKREAFEEAANAVQKIRDRYGAEASAADDDKTYRRENAMTVRPLTEALEAVRALGEKL